MNSSGSNNAHWISFVKTFIICEDIQRMLYNVPASLCLDINRRRHSSLPMQRFSHQMCRRHPHVTIQSAPFEWTQQWTHRHCYRPTIALRCRRQHHNPINALTYAALWCHPSGMSQCEQIKYTNIGTHEIWPLAECQMSDRRLRMQNASTSYNVRRDYWMRSPPLRKRQHLTRFAETISWHSCRTTMAFRWLPANIRRPYTMHGWLSVFLRILNGNVSNLEMDVSFVFAITASTTAQHNFRMCQPFRSLYGRVCRTKSHQPHRRAALESGHTSQRQRHKSSRYGHS